MRLGSGDVEAAALGGALLGGGGGGKIAEGLQLGQAALAAGTPTLVSCGEIAPDALVATVSLVGAPGAPDALVDPLDYVRALELLAALVGRPIAGLIGSENGGTATLNGWLQSAVTGVPIVDAPCDGRAHPTGDLGGLGLDLLPDYFSMQAAAGGSRARRRYIEQQTRGPLPLANQLVRAAAVCSGGLVAVARNPVRADYVSAHGAVGAVTQAIAIGRVLLNARARGARACAEEACEALGGTVVAEGAVSVLERRTEGGFDVGSARIGSVELTIWNEYLTLERSGDRLATFPDLVATLDVETGAPVTSAELFVGRRILVLTAPASSLKLGAGLMNPAHYEPLERAVGKDLVRYVFADGVPLFGSIPDKGDTHLFRAEPRQKR